VIGVLPQRNRVGWWQTTAALVPRYARIVRDEQRRPTIQRENDRRADGIDIDELLGRPRRHELERPGTLDDAVRLATGELVGGLSGSDLDEIEPVVATGEND
jgi:hypothetical protein